MKLRLLALLLVSSVHVAAETRVSVKGLAGRGEQQIMESMGGRLEHVKSSPAAPHLADDAAFLVRQALRKDGYAAAEVDWRIAAPDLIVLTVREGRRLSLGRVTITGADDAEDAKRFAKLYAAPAEKNRPFLPGAPPFREGDVEPGLSFIRQELNARAHWSAEVELRSRETDPKTGAVNLTIAVKPGPKLRIGNPVVRSVDGRGVRLVTERVTPFAGRVATTRNLNAMRLAAEEIAVSRGYPDAVLRMSRGPDAAVFRPEFDINLGTRVRLRGVSVKGLHLTEIDRVERRVKPMEGEWYDEAAMQRRVRELLATGAFSSAQIETETVGERRIDATLHLTEAKAREVSVALGFGSYEGVIGRFTYANRNLMGKLWGLTSGFELSSRGLLGDVRVTDPWIFGSDVSASLRGYALMYSRDGYDSYDTGLEASARWKFGDHYSVELLAGNSVVITQGDGLPTRALGETFYTRPRIRATQKLEHRDSPVLPVSGWHLENPLEIGAAVGGISTTYVSAGLSGGWYRDIGKKYQLGLGGEWGVLIPGGDGDDLPIDIRLFNGGARSVRSFPERELGPLVRGYAVGGEAMWNANVELIREIAGPVKGVLFFDAGSLGRNYDEMWSADVEMATGLGLRLSLPIGPVRFEYGYNLTRDGGEPAGTFHFAIGNAF